MTTDDAAFILELVNDPAWIQYIGDKGIRTLDDARSYIVNGPVAMYAKMGFGLYLTELKESRVPIGMCGLIKRDSLEDVDIGYAYLPAYRAQGYAYEAAAAVLEYGRQTFGLKRIVAITTLDNQASGNLLKKLGMHEEGVISSNDGAGERRLFAVNFNYQNSEAKKQIDQITTAFFRAFTNKGGRTPEVAVMHQLFIPEGRVISNTGAAPVIYNLQQFVEPREKLLTDGSLTDFEEEELSERTEIFGNIAHRFSLYRKTGVLDGKAFETKGMKAMQFLNTPEGWKLSFVAWDDEKR